MFRGGVGCEGRWVLTHKKERMMMKKMMMMHRCCIPPVHHTVTITKDWGQGEMLPSR